MIPPSHLHTSRSWVFHPLLNASIFAWFVKSLLTSHHERVLLFNTCFQVPGKPEEPTSTIVLTSKDSHFVDIRILYHEYEQEKSKEHNTLKCVDWAFAGRSRITKQGSNENGSIEPSHTVWDHWIDSKGNDPAIDEGDLWPQANGEVLERGKQKHPTTGIETEYEELWGDLEVDAIGKKENRSSIVLKAEDLDKDARGMVVKVGGWCQGVLKIGDKMTIERWRRRATDQPSKHTLSPRSNPNPKTYNDWERVFAVGAEAIPCSDVCERTRGKFGLHTVFKSDNEIEWKIIEEYYW